MIGLEFDDSVVVQHVNALEAALSTNPQTQKALNKLIREIILASRDEVVQAASRAMKSDPRGSAQAVRTAVYKKILGANINIYNSRKAHGSNHYEAQRTLRQGQRGGNRRAQGTRTYKMLRYAPADRGMILRWINDGTHKGDRSIQNFKTDERRGRWPSVPKWNKNPNTGNRGAIAPRNWFRSAAEKTLIKAADALAIMIDEELEDLLNKKK